MIINKKNICIARWKPASVLQECTLSLIKIFTISKVKCTEPVAYVLEDYQNKPILGSFYEYELAKVKNDDMYLIEKVLK